MRAVFADTVYWIAMIREDDHWAEVVRQANQRLGRTSVVTTQEVLTEVLDSFATKGSHLRSLAINSIRLVLRNPQVTVLEQSDSSFRRGLDLYEKRRDKGYSLVDCISMSAMERAGIREALTSDRDFEQEGFIALLRL